MQKFAQNNSKIFLTGKYRSSIFNIRGKQPPLENAMLCHFDGKPSTIPLRALENFRSVRTVTYSTVIGDTIHPEFPRTFELATGPKGLGAIRSFDGSDRPFTPGEHGGLEIFSRFGDAERKFASYVDRYNRDARWSQLTLPVRVQS